MKGKFKMKKLIVCFLIVLLSACSTTTSDKSKGEVIKAKDLDKNGGADVYDNGGDHSDSKYYVNPDFYNMKSDENMTILNNFKTMQQTTEYSCGNVAALMTLYHLGIRDYTEEDLAIGMKSSMDLDVENAPIGSANNYHEYGSDVKRMHDYLSTIPQIKIVESSYRMDYSQADLLGVDSGSTGNDLGNLPPTFTYASLYTSDNDDSSENYVEDAKDSYFVKWLTSHLKANRAIMVEWGDWNGHWIDIIGYDSQGTPQIGDDMLIFADSYDTGDHWQDGYTYLSLEKFFSMWKDRNVAPKPFQLQPYIIIDKK